MNEGIAIFKRTDAFLQALVATYFGHLKFLKKNDLLKMGHSLPLLLYFRFFKTVDSKCSI